MQYFEKIIACSGASSRGKPWKSYMAEAETDECIIGWKFMSILVQREYGNIIVEFELVQPCARACRESTGLQFNFPQDLTFAEKKHPPSDPLPPPVVKAKL